jgi:hypothetical protein
MSASTVTFMTTERNRKRVRLLSLLLASAATLFLVTTSAAQTRRATPAAPAEEEMGLFKEYRGVQLGMSADEVRKKLGDPKEKGDEQDFFIFGDNETAQIYYDPTHKVMAISADFTNAATTTPTAKQLFGIDVEAKADGSIYRLVRYPKAGYWLSYNRTTGTAPLTTITIQKIQ